MSHVPQKITPSRDLIECAVCSRCFTVDRIKIHEAICQNVTGIQRKRFDISQQRITGTEVERFIKTAAATADNCLAKSPGSSPCLLSTNWRQKREELMEKINEAKANILLMKKMNDLPLPPPMDSENEYTQCPHCLRTFVKSSISRHVNACAKRMCKAYSKTNMNGQKVNMSEPSLP